MKIKMLLVTFFVTIFYSFSYAQDPVSNFILKHGRKNANERVIIRLSRVPLSLAMPFLDKEGRRWLRKARLVEIMVLEGVRKEMSNDFEKLGISLRRRNFEPLVTISNDGDKVNILGRTDRRDNIRDIVLLVNDNSKDAILVRIKGKFKLSEVEKIQTDIAKNNFISKK